MLYLFTGTDKKTLQKKLQSFVARARAKHPDAAFIELDEETFTPDEAHARIASRGLFDARSIVVIRNPSKQEDAAAFIETNRKAITASPNVFIVFVPDAPQAFLKKLEPLAKSTTRVDRRGQDKKQEFPVFAFAEVCAKRDRKQAWLKLQEAFRAGVSAEQLVGILVWQFKTIALVQQIAEGVQPKTAAKALKPTVYQKAERLAARFKPGEALVMTKTLIAAYHDERQGGPETSAVLEQFVLSL